MSVPKTMRAVVVDGDKAVVKRDVPVPKIFGTQMLVEIKAVAGNPTDWKHVDFHIAPQGSILGCDVAGVVKELGPDVDKTRFAVGDTITGIVHGGSVKFPQNGGFADYALVDSVLSYKLKLNPTKQATISHGSVESFEAAASLPVSLLTAGVVLDLHLGNKLVWEPKTPQHDFPVVLWGGATGVGLWLIQLAKQLNAYSKIVVVASKKHEEHLCHLGADEVFDYHDSDVIDQIKAKYGGFRHLVDCVATPETFQQTYSLASDSADAIVMTLMMYSEKDIPEPERKSNVKVDWALLYLVSGSEVPFGKMTVPARPEYRTAVAEFIKFSEGRVLDGRLIHPRIKVYEGGLDVVPQIMDDVKNGMNSGEKLVAKL
ncbi:uncharacterized protein KLTH0B05610g [Lachancea thermotolerans CBS 6340]|uniref:KLTH0B05610p n=1 Tax=Lachancea thermotolerans (strain ATCC 56472 / CBS 6340 / NRRL Y-8284) TaxID=559295 RepID=C5DCT2_LACTC|nr:KLTH0B05610p [Lachancea thermotolerans CBS 6340]CAR21593.1 KLTH0B05610p [Lachancea thermotolerans CBS 6340]